jgi:hypothetical protein
MTVSQKAFAVVTPYVRRKPMSNKSITFVMFLCLNLLAAYSPSAFWVPDLPGSASLGWKYLFSPVGLILLLGDVMNPVAAWFVLIAFLTVIGLASALLYHSKTAWLTVPCVVAVYSLLQGLLVARAISGIDAIGHS